MIDLETAITYFLTLGRQLQAATSLTGEQVLNELTVWYRDSRIKDAAIDEEEDMLLLQWGATRPLIVAEPTDLREYSDVDLVFAKQDVQYLDFTRQVFAAGKDEEVEFDDVAVQMSITLGFQPATGTEPMSNLWIETPDDLTRGIAEFKEIPFIRSYLTIPAQTITITISRCG